jgi:LysM repeat protein
MKTPLHIRLWILLAGLVFFVGLVILVAPVQAAPNAQLTPFPTPTPGADGRILYIVQPNDTLWRISAITGVSLDQLRTLNRLTGDIVNPGDVLLIGYGGPGTEATETPGPSPTQGPGEATQTPIPGIGNVCVMLYLDSNGNGMREDTEGWITGGQINVSNRAGSVSESAQTEDVFDKFGDPAHLCFNDLPQGSYIVTVAIPDGYNPTTSLSKDFILNPGDEAFISFGAQPNSEKVAETVVIPTEPSSRSPLFAILGGALLVFGLGLGAYAYLLVRKR